jgi:NADPH:quinone reductase-like Zn-dependent oxidoreductase
MLRSENMRSSVCLLLLLAIGTFGAPVPARQLLGGTSGQLPTTMLAAKDSGASACVRPVHGQGGNFDCVETSTVNVPKPLPGTAIVRMNTSSVNPSDVDIVEGKFGKLFGTLGADFSGIVVAVGPFCSKFQVGDAVWGATKGAYAEYAIVVCVITSKLGDVSPRDVGTLPEVSMTSAQALKKAGAPWDPKKNVTVVITSGSGGTGFVAVQLAKAYGAGTVITATGGQANIDFLKSIGADIVVDYHQQELFSTLANNSVDVVYDNYGAAGTADKAMPSLKAGGVFIFLPGKGAALSKHPKEGVKQINYGIMVPSASLLDELLQLYKTDKLKPHVQRSYPLTNVSGAFTESAAGHVLGKLAIVM